MTDNRLYLLDAYALIYRSYYAFVNTPMHNSKGLNTSTIYGFLMTVDDILRNQRPTHLVVVFDTSAKTFRHDMYAAYKQNRLETPEDIKVSVPLIKHMLGLMNIKMLELPGFEADDIIGTVAKDASKNGFEVFMVTPDKDYCQLVEEHIKIFKPKKSGNESEIMGIEEVKLKFSIDAPAQVIDILALWGDASDNVPGVPGIGEVTSKKLIGEFKTIDNLLANVDSLKGKLKDSLIANRELLELSRKLVTIDVQVPIDISYETFVPGKRDTPELLQWLQEFNFKTFINKYFGTANTEKPKISEPQQGNLFAPTAAQAESTYVQAVATSYKTIADVAHTYKVVHQPSEIVELVQYLSGFGEFCFDTETTGLNPHIDELVGLSFSVKPYEAFYVPVPNTFEEAKKMLLLFKDVFENENITKIGHNIKFDILFLHYYGIAVQGRLLDTVLMHYLLFPEQSHKMDALAEKFLNYTPVSINTLIGKKGSGQDNMRNVPLAAISEYAAEDADVTLQLKEKLLPLVEKSGVSDLFANLESKLLAVLIDVELSGFKIDMPFLANYSVELTHLIASKEKEIYTHANGQFNIASPKQLGEILFEKLAIPYEGKLTKTKQYSTNEEVLAQIADKHPIIAAILDYRGLTKLLSTYVDALPKLLSPRTGKVHTSFNQSLAVTGRLSSNNPNLQNIPIRDANGREIRKAFTPSNPENVILSADYSQIELRIMAHFSNDANLIDAFSRNEDIHTATAAKIFHIETSEVTREQRSKAKTANFGIIYGISAFGLSQRLNISRKEANDLISEYFNSFPGVRRYMSESILFAKEYGYVETLLKRRRYLADIHSSNVHVRGMAERNAINSPIQGTAADIIKLAMIRIYDTFRENKIASKMILQVHDELVFDVVPGETEKVKVLVKQGMEQAVELQVPLLVEMGLGSNWLEAH